MAAGETRMRWWCSRCQAMVSGPASRPRPTRSLRSSVIRATVVSGIARVRPPGAATAVRTPLRFLAVAGQEGVDPGPDDPVGARYLADRPLLDRDRRDDQPGFRHSGRVAAPGSLAPPPLRYQLVTVLDVLGHPSSMS